MKNSIKVDELRKEKDKLEGDRTALNERLQAINAERERIIQQMTMIAGALQTLNHFIDKIDPEVDLEDEIDLSPDESHGPGPDEEK
jgi:predicted nuclease with TOPRIM domain